MQQLKCKREQVKLNNKKQSHSTIFWNETIAQSSVWHHQKQGGEMCAEDKHCFVGEQRHYEFKAKTA